MAPVEELTDEFKEALKIDTPIASQAPISSQSTVPPSVPFPLPLKSQDEDSNLPQIPPQMESIRSHTADEIVGMMSKTPLFMTSLEDAADGMSTFLLRA